MIVRAIFACVTERFKMSGISVRHFNTSGNNTDDYTVKKDALKMEKKTKIVATVGPVSQSSAVLRELILAGVDVFRLNFSHGDYTSHQQTIQKIDRLRQELGKPVAILQDLSGPKIRVGIIDPEPLVLRSGEQLILDASLTAPSRENRVGVNYADFARDVYAGAHLLLADGALELEVVKVEPPRVHCRVIIGGELYSHKGVNFPGGSFNIPALTEKDEQDLHFGLDNGVDLVALSFVRSAADLERAKSIIARCGRPVPLIAKIEKHEAVDNLSEIVAAADGIMVARGDLGVEIEIERVPVVQKQIILMANNAGKPVITATQMLRSMVDSPRPTRAEVTDIANAILDGSDAIMLSEETAVGKYPVKAVETMVHVARQAEGIYPYYKEYQGIPGETERKLTTSLAHSATILSRDLDASLMLAATRSGYTAKCLAKFRPCSYILALTPDKQVYYQLALIWGVKPVVFPLQKELKQLFTAALKIAVDHRMIRKGERYVFVSGFPLGKPGSINQITAGQYPHDYS